MIRTLLQIAVFAVCVQTSVGIADEKKPPAKPKADEKPKADAPAKPAPAKVVAQAKAAVVINRVVGGATPATAKPEIPLVGLMLADRPIRIRLIRAKELLGRGETGVAIDELHAALQSPDDSGYQVNSLDRTTDRALIRNIRWEAEQLVGQLADPDRETYELRFGPTANQALESARADSDLEAIAEVSRRFFHTTAGHEATIQLAAAYFDLGRPLEAGLWFDRLKGSHYFQLGNEQNGIALRSAVAWSMSGMPERAGQILSELTSDNPKQMQIGGKTVDHFKDANSAERWLRSLGNASLQTRPYTAIGWPLVGGNAARNATFEQPPIDDVATWQVKTSTWKVRFEDAPFSNGVINVARQIDGIEESINKTSIPAIPTTRPLVVDKTVLVKSLSQLQAFDLDSGKLKWQTNDTNEFEQVRKGTIKPLPGDTGSILDPMLRDRVFANSTYGTMSSNGQNVFSVVGLGYADQTKTPTNYIRSSTQSSHPLAVKPFNALVAHDVANGKLIWEVGGAVASPQNKLSGRFFLGPPLPLAGQVFCLAERNQQIELVVLSAATGRLDWIKPVQSFGLPVTSDAARATGGLSPSYSDGRLVCPTSSGVVVAFDLATRESVWSYRYRDLNEGDPRTRARMLAMARLAAQRRGEKLPVEKPGNWLDACPIIVGNQVILTPRDSKELICLDLASGSLQWKLPREDRAFIGGVDRSGLIVVAAKKIELLNLQTGAPMWKQPITIPSPVGRGVVLGNRFHIPVQSGQLATIDLEHGRVKLKNAKLNGNLVVANNAIIVQSPTVVARVQPAQWSDK